MKAAMMNTKPCYAVEASLAMRWADIVIITATAVIAKASASIGRSYPSSLSGSNGDTPDEHCVMVWIRVIICLLL